MYIRNYATETPKALAIVMAESGEQITFGALEERANQVAHLLRQRGLQRGDHIALLMENHVRYFEIILAASRLGLYYTPINSHLTALEAGFILDDCAATVLFTTTKLHPIASGAIYSAPRVAVALVVDPEPDVTLEAPFGEYKTAVAEHPTAPVADEALGLVMMYSSGTTGRPKGIMRPLPTLQPSADESAVRMGRGLMKFRPGMTLLSPAPLYHAAPHAAAAAALQLGATTVVMPRFDAEEVLANVERFGVTHLQLVPTMMGRILKLPTEVRERYDISSLEAVVHSAAPCPIPVKRAMIEWLGPIVYEYYGATESYGFTRCTSQEWLQHPGTVGKAVTGRIVIADDDAQPCEPRQPGTVWFVTGAQFEYFGAESVGDNAPAPRVPGGATVGDVGWLDEDGYLYLTDRKTFMIVTGGVNVYPQEVEDALMDHPAVADAAVIGVPDDDLGEAVKAVVVVEPGSTPGSALETQLIAHCRASIAGFKCPRSIDFVQSLPRLESGKLAKARVRARYWTSDEQPSSSSTAALTRS